jgi:hypothetical protein
MNDRNLDQLLNAWMDLGPTTAPDRVADAARLEAAATRQLPAIVSRWAPRRFPVMNTTAKVILATAAVVLAVVLGYTYLVAPNVGGPRLFGPEPTPTPVPTPSPDPIPTLELGAGALAPGSYQITDFEPINITITVPNGWESNAVPAMVWSVDGQKATVAYFTVDDLFADPCDPAQGSMGVGPTVDDLAAALSTYPGITVNSGTNTTLSGFSGTLLDITSTGVECDGPEAVMWTTQPDSIERPLPGGGAAFQQVLILDVNGERLVIHSGAPSNGAPSQRIDEAMSIVDSTVIVFR